jgi:uncharacterized protein with PIN domain
MLGSLAKWLRILGFDTFYVNAEMTDEELLNIAKVENRIVISRDKELILRGKKQSISMIEIKDTELDDQLKMVLNLIKIDKKLVFSRCTLCNTTLKTIGKGEVEGKVPRKVFDKQDKFWFCNRCNKYYDKITDKIKEITKGET